MSENLRRYTRVSRASPRAATPTSSCSTSTHARRNGATEPELIEAITDLAFYAGWPKAMSAMAVAKRVFASDA